MHPGGNNGLNSNQLNNTGQQITGGAQYNHLNNSSNQNRKLTPSKQNINIRGNQSIPQQHQIVGRPYEKKTTKINGRSNTIEIGQEKDSRKNVKRRGPGQSIDAEQSGLLKMNINGQNSRKSPQKRSAGCAELRDSFIYEGARGPAPS